MGALKIRTSFSALKVQATEGSKANCPFPSSSSRYFFPLMLFGSYYVSENMMSSSLLLFIVCQLFLLHLLAYRLLLCVCVCVCVVFFTFCLSVFLPFVIVFSRNFFSHAHLPVESISYIFVPREFRRKKNPSRKL